MKNIAIILAGGIGSRLNAGIPKQFLKVAGMSIIEHTINAFQNHAKIDEIAIVANDVYHNKIDTFIIKNHFSKVKKVLNSGSERYLSSLSAIQAYEREGECNLIFHDAVRPLISPRIISDVILALEKYQAVDVAIEAVDTIIQVDAYNVIRNIPVRKNLKRGQTPQGFRLSVIKRAYELALSDPDFSTTDDCGVVLKYLPDTKIFVVSGDDANMKLTYKEDLYLMEKLFQLKTIDYQEGKLTDEEKLLLRDKIIVVFGASSGIGYSLCNVCRQCGAIVYGYSRAMNNIDIQDETAVEAVLKEVYQKERHIDYVVDTASVLYKEPLMQMDYLKIQETINTNYKGMVNVAKESFIYLKESKGHLLYYTSSSYTRGRMNYSIYSSTKCATVNFVQALAEEWGYFGIRVNCINPERTNTPMRMRNFGIEPEGSLLQPIEAAMVSAKVLVADITGQVVDIKINRSSNE